MMYRRFVPIVFSGLRMMPFLACISVVSGLQGCSSSERSADLVPLDLRGSNRSDSVVSLSAAARSETYSPASSALVFASDRLNEQSSIAGLVPGFTRVDWEYGRNDARLGAGRPVWYPLEQWSFIEQVEQVFDTDGRIRTHGYSRLSSGTGWLSGR